MNNKCDIIPISPIFTEILTQVEAGKISYLDYAITMSFESNPTTIFWKQNRKNYYHKCLKYKATKIYLICDNV